MKRVVPSLGSAVVLLLVCAASTLPAASAEDGEVRLYTNADLERYPALPDSTVEASSPSVEEWRFVTEYLDRRYSRIESDREYELERERTEAEVDRIRNRANRRSYGLPYYWNSYGRWDRVPVGSHGKGPKGRFLGAALPDGSIRPLHAGPTRAQIDYFKATRRSGADAFPSRSFAGPVGGRKRR